MLPCCTLCCTIILLKSNVQNQVQEESEIMEATTYSDFRKDLKSYMDKATGDFEPITITRKNRKNAVLISEDEYNNMLENRYVLENPTNREWL